jgi:hypothetical protein
MWPTACQAGGRAATHAATTSGRMWSVQARTRHWHRLSLAWTCRCAGALQHRAMAMAWHSCLETCHPMRVLSCFVPCSSATQCVGMHHDLCQVGSGRSFPLCSHPPELRPCPLPGPGAARSTAIPAGPPAGPACPAPVKQPPGRHPAPGMECTGEPYSDVSVVQPAGGSSPRQVLHYAACSRALHRCCLPLSGTEHWPFPHSSSPRRLLVRPVRFAGFGCLYE